MADDPFKTLPDADPFSGLPSTDDPFTGLPDTGQSAAFEGEADSAQPQPSPRASRPPRTPRVFESQPPTAGRITNNPFLAPPGDRRRSGPGAAADNPFGDLPDADGPFGDLPDLPQARAEPGGFLNNLGLSELQRAAETESMAANLAKFFTGNTDESRREERERFKTDLTEQELDATAEQFFQEEGPEGENFQAAQAALTAYREARQDPEFDLGMIQEVFAEDPGGFMAEVTKLMIIDPQLMFTPLGWARAAVAAGRAAKAAGAGAKAERSARVAGGAGGAAATGAAIEAPISIARQLGETGEITDPGRIAGETGLAAAGSALVAGGIKGTVAGVRAGREAARRGARGRLDEDIRRSTSPDEPILRTRQTEHGEVVEGEMGIFEDLPNTGAERVDLDPETGRPVRPAGRRGEADLERVEIDPDTGQVRPVREADEARRLEQPDPAREVDPSIRMNQRAAELDRLARATDDAELRQDFFVRARKLREEAAGAKPTKTPAERFEERRAIDLDNDDLITVVRKMGGVKVGPDSPDAARDLHGRLSHLSPKRIGLPAIEQSRGGGLTLDELAERLRDLDFITEQDADEVFNLLDRASRGDEIFSLRAEGDNILERLAGERPEPAITDQDFTFHRPGADPVELDTNFVIDSETATVRPSRPIDLEDLRRLEQEEANAQQFFEAEEASARGEPTPGGRAAPGEPAPRGEEGPFADLGGRTDPVGPRDGAPDTLSGRPRGEPGDDPQDGPVRRPGRRLDDTDDTEPGPRSAGAGTRAGTGRPRPITENATEQVAEARRFGQTVRHSEVDRLPTAIRQVNQPDEVAHLSARIRKDPQETVMVVATDDAGRVLRVSRIGRGTNRNAAAHPGLTAATGVSAPGARRLWVIHNHPSGSPRHSRSDTDFAENMQELLRDTGVRFEGSVVVSPAGRFTHFHPDPSVRQIGEPKPIPAGSRGEAVPVSERRFSRSIPAQTSRGEPVPSVKQPGALESIFEGLGGREGLVLTNNLGQPQAFVPLSRDQMAQLRNPDTFRRVIGEFDATNATGFAARINSDDADELQRVARNLDGFANQSGFTMHDVVSPTQGLASELTDDAAARTFYANPFLHAGVQVAKNATKHPGRAGASMFAGSVAAATLSDEEIGSARWWADLALGGAAGLGLSQFLRSTNLLGPGSIVDNSRARLGAAIDNLPILGRGPQELRDIKRKQRLMKEYIERQTAEIGRELLDRFTPSERAMMADLIENRGIIKDFNLVHEQAQALDDYLTFVTRRMKDLGMLTEDLAEGGHLHRYYAKHLGLEGTFRKAKQQSLAGSYTINRGTLEPFPRENLSPRAQELSDRYDVVRDELEALKRQGDLLDEDPNAAARREQLRAELDEIKNTELHEFTGLQNGKLRSFIFRSDEVPRVDTGGGDIVQALRRDGRPGELGPTGAEPLPGVEKLTPTDRVWSVRGVHRTKQGIALRRDWTKAERQSWGEIEDAGYRFVRGMAEVAHDLSLATMFRNIARRPEWVSSSEVEGWVQVPTTKVNKNSPLQKYGDLAGQWIDPKIWNGIKRHGRNTLGDTQLAKRYQDLNNKWKIYKTVYNPVTHINNTYSNIEMLLQSDHSLSDLKEGLRLMRQGENSEVWQEASRAGLFGNDFTASVIRGTEGGNSQILDDLAEQLRTQDEIPDAELAMSHFMRIKEWWINSKNALDEADGAWQTGAELAKAMGKPALAGLRTANKPVKAATRAMTRAYRFEDNVFKMAVFQASRKQGMSIDESVRQAQGLFFDYSDIPDAIRWARDLPLGSPFITYTYFAAQAVARNAVRNPEKIAALIAGYEAMNFAALVADGMSPGEYWKVESAEEDLSPPWDRGRAVWGARNTVRIPGLDGYRLAMGRAHALGNPFMTDAGGREKLPSVPHMTNFWGSSIFGSNPAHALLDISVNENWQGKEIYNPGDPTEEKVSKSMNYLFQAWSPSNALFPGSYHQQRILEGLANQARTGDSEVAGAVVNAANGVAEALGWEQFTGLNRLGDEVNTRDAVLGSFGIKMRPIQHELSLDIEQSKLDREIRTIDESIDKQARLFGEDRITESQLNTALERRQEDQQALIDEQIRLGEQADVLRDQGLFRSGR